MRDQHFGSSRRRSNPSRTRLWSLVGANLTLLSDAYSFCQRDLEMSGSKWAVSSHGRNGAEHLAWFHPSKGLSRTSVEFASYGVEARLAVGAEVSRLGDQQRK